MPEYVHPTGSTQAYTIFSPLFVIIVTNIERNGLLPFSPGCAMPAIVSTNEFSGAKQALKATIWHHICQPTEDSQSST